MDQALADTRTKELFLTRSVYKTISYFDIFNFPLKAEEIHRFCGEKMNKDQLELCLKDLLHQKKLQQNKDYYFLPGVNEGLIEKRKENEVNLTRELTRIKRYAALVSKFPFVQSVFISGSVSKGVLESDGDVDYFIISRPQRVWLCRTVLVAFKKIFLLNSRKYFCVNYFIDTNNLQIPDQNLFVATELATLIPVVDTEVTKNFWSSNDWASKLFPNFEFNREVLVKGKSNRPLASKWIEMIGKGNFGERLDNFCFNLTLSRWKKKFPHFNRDEFDLNMRSYKNVSKHHPQGHQQRVLKALEERMQKFDAA